MRITTVKQITNRLGNNCLGKGLQNRNGVRESKERFSFLFCAFESGRARILVLVRFVMLERFGSCLSLFVIQS